MDTTMDTTNGQREVTLLTSNAWILAKYLKMEVIE